MLHSTGEVSSTRPGPNWVVAGFVFTADLKLFETVQVNPITLDSILLRMFCLRESVPLEPEWKQTPGVSSICGQEVGREKYNLRIAARSILLSVVNEFCTDSEYGKKKEREYT